MKKFGASFYFYSNNLLYINSTKKGLLKSQTYFEARGPKFRFPVNNSGLSDNVEPSSQQIFETVEVCLLNF